MAGKSLHEDIPYLKMIVCHPYSNFLGEIFEHHIDVHCGMALEDVPVVYF